MIRHMLLGLALCFCAAVAWADTCAPNVVDIRTDNAQIRFTVELAATPADRSQGLMFREHMPRSAGMLFVYDHPQRVSFWMKNTLIPLDMIFIDRRGVVSRVHSNAIPGDLTPIKGGRNIFSVLEINGGLAEKYGISPGAELRHEIFSKGPAAWPC